jgi:hypothetical protein
MRRQVWGLELPELLSSIEVFLMVGYLRLDI